MELQRLLLLGKSEEAYNFAISQQMWTHALILASNSSVERFRDTVFKYANAALVEGAPLHTQYMLLSGKRQGQCLFSFLTGIELFQAGNGRSPPILSSWKGTLVSFLINNTGNLKGMVGNLGDQLWASQGRVAAAHF